MINISSDASGASAVNNGRAAPNHRIDFESLGSHLEGVQKYESNDQVVSSLAEPCFCHLNVSELAQVHAGSSTGWPQCAYTIPGLRACTSSGPRTALYIHPASPSHAGCPGPFSLYQPPSGPSFAFSAVGPCIYSWQRRGFSWPRRLGTGRSK
jgi:hypothetical protein